MSGYLGLREDAQVRAVLAARIAKLFPAYRSGLTSADGVESQARVDPRCVVQAGGWVASNDGR